jgi:hypothetical protein
MSQTKGGGVRLKFFEKPFWLAMLWRKNIAD